MITADFRRHVFSKIKVFLLNIRLLCFEIILRFGESDFESRPEKCIKIFPHFPSRHVAEEYTALR